MMPRLTTSLPKYRKHKASGQAFVELNGKRFYLGPHGTQSSKREYDRRVGEWQQNGRRLPSEGSDLLVVELLALYLKHALSYYQKDGKPTGAIHGIRAMLKFVKKFYCDKMISEFGPLALKSLQSRMVDSNYSRKYINERIQWVKRMFKWAASNEHIPHEYYQRLTTVEGLKKGRSKAREPAPILPVEDEVIDATLPHLSAVVADMVHFQRLTGCRPSEVCILRPCDIDRSEDVWVYRPSAHKTEHHDRDRVIPIGPQLQEILRPYLLRDKQSFCFSPLESEQQRRRKQHEDRKTPIHQGNRPGTNKKRSPKKRTGEQYNENSYRKAIHRACDKAFAPEGELARHPDESVAKWKSRLSDEQLAKLKVWQKSQRWSPNQLRHSHGTFIRKQFGLEAAQVVLGHASAKTTEIYAEKDLAKAIEIARKVG